MAFSESPSIQTLFAEATRLRLANGRPVQILDEGLCVSSQEWANRLANEGRLYHDINATEIIYGHSDPNAPLLTPFPGWMDSVKHRLILLSEKDKCGFGVARTKHGTRWVGRFASGSTGPTDPTEPIPPVTPAPKPKPKWFDWLWWFLGSRRR